MRVFLHDYVEVLSRPAGNGATPKMEAYTLKIFNSRAKIPFMNSKDYDQAKIFIVFD